ncbi:MAG: hypothetical protein ACXWKX_15340 [Caulobacteraceae bacterium]
MSDAASDQTDDSAGPESWERALLDRQLAELSRLADMGMAMAAAIERRVTADEAGSPSNADLHHAAMDFARVSRAVRMSFALQSRLIAEFKGAAAARAAGAAAPDDGPLEVVWASDLPHHDVVQKRQVRGIVQRLAEAASLDREGVERLVCEAVERLEDDDIYRDLSRRPLGEIVALICKDLGLEPDWGRIAGEYWAEAEIAKRPTGSPYAGWTAGRTRDAPPHAASP